MLAELVDRIERAEALDAAVDQVGEVVGPVLSGDRTSWALSGAWLGHALHPLTTDMVIGPWLSAYVLDLVGGAGMQRAARRLIGVGILASLPTAAAGAHDWMDEETKVQRAGLVHAVVNVVGLGLQAASWIARGRGRQTQGVLLSTAAMAAVSAGGYLGGHLSYVLGAGVARTAFQKAPDGWTPTVPRSALADGPLSADADGTPILLVDDGGVVRALADTCSHVGCSLAEGRIEAGTITCGCHGSRFSLSDGSVVAGPAATPQPVFQTQVVDGVVHVRQQA